MATAADVIRRALKLLGVLAAGESLRAEDQADGLVELNLLVATWANERLLTYGVRRSTHTLTGALSPHTIGVGGTFNVARPVRIDRASIIGPGLTMETPIELLTDAQYQDVGDKTRQEEMPAALWVEWTHPAAKLWLVPVPSVASTLVLYTWSRITAFAVTDTVDLPVGYENALAHALALQIAPMYGVEPSGLVVNNATESLASIKRANMQTPDVEIDAGLRTHGGGNATVLGGGSDSGGLY